MNVLPEEHARAKAPAPRPVAVATARGQGVLAVVDQCLVSGVSFVTAVVVGRLCGKEDLGTYSAAWSVLLFLRGVQIEVLAAPYKIACHQPSPEDDVAEQAGSTVAYQMVLAGLSAVALALLGGVLAAGDGWPGLARALWVLAATVPFLLLREAIRQLALAHLRMGEVLAIDAAVAVLQLGGLLALAWSGLLGVETVFAVSGAACALACLGWFLLARPAFRVVPGRVGSDWRRDWPFARWMLCSYLVGSTIPYIVPWVVTLTQGAAANGLLAACTTLINLAGTYVAGVSGLVAPRAARALAQGGPAALRQVLRQTIVLFVVTLGPFCLLVAALGDLPATLVYGGRFSGVGAVLAVLSLHVLVNSLGMTVGCVLWVIKAPQANFAADVCVLVVTLGALLGLGGPLGVLGAALATLAGSTVGLAVRAWTLARYWKTLTLSSWRQVS
jgi:O-antigen/teichoic acid export membrane protein